MNATKAFSNAIKLALKPAAIGFITIIGLGIASSFAIAVSALLALLIPTLLLATKAAIFGYLPFLTGLIALKLKEQYQTKETRIITSLHPSKFCEKRITQEEITNEVLITLPPIESIIELQTETKQPTWEQWILSQIQPKLPNSQSQPEIKEISQLIEKPTKPNIKPLSNRLATSIICWQAFSQIAELLNAIKASELKSIASKLKIPNCHSMNKTQLLVAISQEDLTEFAT